MYKSSRKTNFRFREQLLRQMLTIWLKNQMPQGQVPGLRNIAYRLTLTYDLISLPYALHSSFGLWLRKYLNSLPDIKFQTDWRLFKLRIQGIMQNLGFQTHGEFQTMRLFQLRGQVLLCWISGSTSMESHIIPQDWNQTTGMEMNLSLLTVVLWCFIQNARVGGVKASWRA